MGRSEKLIIRDLAGVTIGLFTLLTETGLLMGITGWIGTEASRGKSNEDKLLRIYFFRPKALLQGL